VLLDMGVEGRNLYTADVTRTLPVDGTLHPAAARPLHLVYDAQQAGIDAVKPGRAVPGRPQRRDGGAGARARGPRLLPVSAEEALDPTRRSTPAGPSTAPATCSAWTSTTAASCLPEVYPKGDLAEGMVLTVEPGLYFQEDDLLVPEELRGIGIRIEDDILVTADGCRNLSDSAPPHADDVEDWMVG
jgi:Xaa-Pro aminopeptidase